MTEDELYSSIEAAIIRWNLDGTKTAGELTREIMFIIEQNNMEELFWNTENPDKPGLYICDLGPYRGVQLGHWDGDDWLFDGNIIRQVGGWISSPKYKQQDNG